MEEMIGKLERLEEDLLAMRDHLQEQEWPARSISLVANDLNTWLGMAANTTATLHHILSKLESTKVEVKDVIEEEKGGEVPSEQVSEPEDRETGGEIPPQEPGEEEPPGD